MKVKLILLIFCIFGFFASLFSQNIEIKGKIIDGHENHIRLRFFKQTYSFAMDEVEYVVPIEPNGNFIFNIPLNKAIVAICEYEKHQQKLFLEPNSTLNIQFNSKNFPDNIVITGSGAGNCNYFKEYEERNLQKLDILKYDYLIDSLSTGDILVKIDSIYQKKQQFFEEYTSNHTVSDLFKTYIQLENTYHRINGILSYEIVKLSGQIRKNHKDLPKSLDDVKVYVANGLISREYINFLVLYPKYLRLTAKKSKEQPNLLTFSYNFYKDNLYSEVKSHMLVEVLLNMNHSGNSKEYKSLFKDINKLNLEPMDYEILKKENL